MSLKTKHQANSEYLATTKDKKPLLCKDPINKGYFVSIFFSPEYVKKLGFIVLK
jgi:hypothetical protein